MHRYQNYICMRICICSSMGECIDTIDIIFIIHYIFICTHRWAQTREHRRRQRRGSATFARRRRRRLARDLIRQGLAPVAAF